MVLMVLCDVEDELTLTTMAMANLEGFSLSLLANAQMHISCTAIRHSLRLISHSARRSSLSSLLVHGGRG